MTTRAGEKAETHKCLRDKADPLTSPMQASSKPNTHVSHLGPMSSSSVNARKGQPRSRSSPPTPPRHWACQPTTQTMGSPTALSGECLTGPAVKLTSHTFQTPHFVVFSRACSLKQCGHEAFAFLELPCPEYLSYASKSGGSAHPPTPANPMRHTAVDSQLPWRRIKTERKAPSLGLF